MAFVEDTRPYFADFGATATKSGVAVAGIFDSAYTAAFDMIGLPMEEIDKGGPICETLLLQLRKKWEIVRDQRIDQTPA